MNKLLRLKSGILTCSKLTKKVSFQDTEISKVKPCPLSTKNSMTIQEQKMRRLGFPSYTPNQRKISDANTNNTSSTKGFPCKNALSSSQGNILYRKGNGIYKLYNHTSPVIDSSVVRKITFGSDEVKSEYEDENKSASISIKFTKDDISQKSSLRYSSRLEGFDSSQDTVFQLSPIEKSNSCYGSNISIKAFPQVYSMESQNDVDQIKFLKNQIEKVRK